MLFCAVCRSAPPNVKVLPIASLELYDCGFLGGCDLLVLSNGIAFARVVERPRGESAMREQRFKIRLKSSELAQLRAVLSEHHFSRITIKDRPGIPDETRTVIRVRFSDGQRKEISKWAADNHADFDPIYQHLLGIVNRASKTQPVYSGAVDDEWKPEEFQQWREPTRRSE